MLGCRRHARSRLRRVARAQAVRLRRHRVARGLPPDAHRCGGAGGGIRAVLRSSSLYDRGARDARAARVCGLRRRSRHHGEGLGSAAGTSVARRAALRARHPARAALGRVRMARGVRARMRGFSDMIESLAIRLPNWLGDTVMAEPMLRALRRTHSQARVLLAGPWAAVLGGQGLADTLVTYPRTWAGRLAAADVVRRFAPDTAVLMPNSLESALAAWYWGARRRVGFDIGGRAIALTDALALPTPRRHQIDEYLMLAERCDARVDSVVPTLAPPPAGADERTEARA